MEAEVKSDSPKGPDPVGPTETIQEELPFLREHEPLVELLSQIPRKAQKGMLIQCDLVLTCIDANEDFIALGSNVGLVFVFDQKKRTVEHKLRTESNNDTISVVQLHKGLDNHVAIGTNGGIVYIFQLPSSLPGQNKQLQQFVVQNLHHSSVTSLAWSLNGMKLFSGDRKGLVVCTDVDFYEKQCGSSISLEEKQSEIVQLHHAHKSLLVSTLHRSFVYRPHFPDSKLTQVGKKDRKILGNYGACFIPGLCNPEHAQLYAARPGLRVWKAGIDGIVLNTNLFKDLLSQPHRDVPIIPYEGQTRNQLKSSDQQFGTLLLYRDKYLVTWSSSHLYLLNPDNNTVVASQARLGVLVGVAATEDDLFILRRNTSRNVVRLGLKPLAKQESVYERVVRERQLAADAVKNKYLQQGSTTNTRELDVRPRSDKPSKSPLKFLQENVLDKFKVLDKVAGKGGDNSVSHLVSSMDRFGHNDEVDGGHSQEIDRSQIAGYKMSCDSDSPSPSKTLPPVVQLDSQDLLTVEIFSGIPPKTEIFSSAKTYTYKSSPYKGRFNPFSSDSVSDTEAEEICTDQIGTMRETTILKCEEKGDNQDVVSQNSENSILPEESSRPPPKFMIEKLDKVLKNETPSDDIVFAHRQKIKGRKKRKPAKEKDDEAESQTNEVEVTPVNTDVQSEVKQGGESPRSVSPDSKSEEPVGEPLNMDEPEDADKFREISRELESFERTLTDLPGHLIQTQNTTMTEENVQEEGHEDIVNGNTTAGRQETDGNSSGVRSEGTQPSVIPAVVDTSDHTVTGILDDGHGSASVVPGMSAVHIVQSANTYTEQPKEKCKTTKCVNNKEVNLSHSSSEIVAPVTIPDTSGENLTPSSLLDSSGTTVQPSTIPDSSEVPINKSTLALIESEEEDSIYSPKKNDASQERVKDKMDDLVNDTRQYFSYKTPDASIEDIYGKTGGLTPSPSESQKGVTSLAVKGVKRAVKQAVETADACETLSKSLINNWTEATTGGNLWSLAISNSHVWVVDKSCNVYYSSLQVDHPKWQKIKDYGNQIAVSRSGYIMWRLYKNTVYAGTKITPRHPEGMKWVEAVRNVQFVAVDNNCAWYIKITGEVMIQSGLSKDRPCFKSSIVPGDELLRFRQVVCQDSIVWAVTDECKLMYRLGVSDQCPEGKTWQFNDHVGEDVLFSYVALGDNGVGWGIDLLGRILFIAGVSKDTPMGQECWWQVPVSGILTEDLTALDSLRSLAKKFDPQKLAHLLSTQRGGLITAGMGGVWVCSEFKNTLQICRGNMEGHSWRGVNMAGFTSSIAWKILSASVSSYKHGLVWCVQPNGDVFTLSTSTGHTKNVESPSPRHRLVGLSACPEAVWGLTENGFVFIRDGVRPDHPQGTEWVKLDLLQLGDVHLVSVSCGHTNVWALDSDGVVYQRIGVKAPSTHSLIQAWLPVDSGTSSGTTFSQISSGPKDWMVWAIDNRRQVYTRTGITDRMPIGTSWVHVPGTLAQQITISERNVWALNPVGEILCRYGVSPENPTGDYWRKVTGTFIHISTSASDDIWAINQDGHIYRRRTKFLLRKQTGGDPLLEKNNKRGISSSSDDGWELV
ncbi:tectonin beta-propeller repeat-containing protein 2-like isoform X1 [Mizuhopecten yessoensis]|uniref:tectonin beta-propeller repeat-containing protein 2-like isoform X1 n=1 Tax=Mizuhopecten yessoensis TaxID=6573 RepID=UPI000B459CE8|nr:tectonin beta-propeller repeat-containing protein 2-like isoform X1 [Mizuhopecten yessoensis]